MAVAISCPLCSFQGGARGLHTHLSQEHKEVVRIEQSGAKRYYEVRCPTCGVSHRQDIKPGYMDPAFIEGYEEEIRLVATDMLVNHIIGEHVVFEEDDNN